MIRFSIEHKDSGSEARAARAGKIETPHGILETPAFIPVGTKATVKALTVDQIKDGVKAQAVLANTYHLYLQPGHELVKKAGGLHSFMNWNGPIFTDSGGFQAFSLGAAWGKNISKLARAPAELSESETESDHSEMVHGEPLAKITEDGVTFKSVIDGSSHHFTPEKSMEIQEALGADIIFAFDECTSPHASHEYQKEAMERTHHWARRSLEAHTELQNKREKEGRKTQALFGIAQGGRFEDLRRESARIIGGMDFPGFGVGGSFEKEDIGTAVGWVCDELPEDRPRHLLGIGGIEDIILAIEKGIDTFDCVAPTRIARNGTVYVSGEKRSRINLLNAQFTNDLGPLDPKCDCIVCKSYSRAYIAHPFRAKEMLAATLASIHNLYYIVQLVRKAREAIYVDKFGQFKEECMLQFKQ